MSTLTNLIAFIISIASLFEPASETDYYTEFGREDLSELIVTLEDELDRLADYNMVDGTKFVLTFEDDFDGDALDRNVWTGHYSPYGGTSVIRRGGYWNSELARVEDGKLIIPLIYSKDGMDGGGPGWYTVGLDTDGEGDSEGFQQAYGYFEVRCILPPCPGWAAFWLSNNQMGHVGDKGRDGMEIDIFESLYYTYGKNNMVVSNLHYDGYGPNLHTYKGRPFPVEGDPYSEFNVYALEWNEKEYTFYINGEETFHTSFGGVCRNPEYLLLSLEVAGKDGVCAPDIDESREYDFIVDYVRVYQYRELAEAADSAA